MRAVADGRGEPVKGLTRDDFELRENGEVQQIASFQIVAGSNEWRSIALTVKPRAPSGRSFFRASGRGGATLMGTRCPRRATP
jgi:hypothetical protein